MKIWFKYLLGILLGIASSFILPVSSPGFISGITNCTEFAVRLGCYILVPLVFSSTVIASFKLGDTRQYNAVLLNTLAVIIVTSMAATILGLLLIMAIKLPRIPITNAAVSSVATLNITDMLRSIFPFVSLSTLLNENFMFPCFMFASFIGCGSILDRAASKQVIQFFDSFSTVCYQISVFFTELISITIIALTVHWMMEYRILRVNTVFLPLIILLLCIFIVVTVVIYPAVLYFVFHDHHPYRVLYAGIAPLLTAFFSGNTNLTLPVIIRVCKDNLGIRRRTNGITAPLFSILGRSGSALITSICFVLIWRSYSNLSMAFSDILWITVTAFGLSFTLGNLPTGGTFFALTVLCTMYGRGLETGYLLLQPAAFIISSFAAALDTVTTLYGSYFVAARMKQIRHKEIKHFI